MDTNRKLQNEIIHFIRNRDYKLVKELGSGACGQTVLLYDDQIEELFVCKKYQPCNETLRETLFAKFIQEIKLLHQLHHQNVVRVFNHYLYPEKFAGYILMEYVDGSNIEDYVRNFPEQINELFVQAIDGFSYLERSDTLHRDIRPGNLLVTQAGQLKIIDLGFGKRIETSKDFDKSITLNWWCTPPKEFGGGRYDFSTEVYFVGKLFEELIQENDIGDFKYPDLLRKMCEYDYHVRSSGFAEVEKTVRSDQFFEIKFTEDEIEAYRGFADAVSKQITKIESAAGYVADPAKIQSQLSDVYRSVMLEPWVPNASTVIGCLLTGSYYYRQSGFPTSCLRDFLKLLKSSSPERNRIVIANLHARLDAIKRYDATITDDDIPF